MPRCGFRRLSDAERRLAVSVFGDAEWIPRVLVTPFRGLDGRAFVFPVGRRLYLLNTGRDRGDLTRVRTRAYPVAGQLLVHELAHVWQFAGARGVIGMLAGAVVEQIRYLRGADVYGLAGSSGEWEELTFEEQASVVDRWFAGRDVDLRHVDFLPGGRLDSR